MDELWADFKELGLVDEDCSVVSFCKDIELLSKLENVSKRFLALTINIGLSRSPLGLLLSEALLQTCGKCLKSLRRPELCQKQPLTMACLLQMSTAMLRMIRNGFAGNITTDVEPGKLGSFLVALNEILEDILSRRGVFGEESSETVLFSRCCLQVVVNFASSGKSNSKESLRMFGRNLVALVCSGNERDQKSRVYATAALHASLIHSEDVVSDLRLHGPNCSVTLLMQKLLSTLVHDEGTDESEWSLFLFKMMLKSSNYLEDVWRSMSVKEREFTVEVLASDCESLVDQSTDPGGALEGVCHWSNLDHLCLELSNQMASFVRGEGQVTSDESCCHPLLNLLSQVSSCFHMLTGMKHTTSLLGHSTDLLNLVQSASKQKVDLPREERSLLSEIRRDLVRLIANLVYRNKEHQDLMRDNGGFHLVLNMTTIDTFCPTIQQWALFAINNLCEDNEENRKFISDLKLERVADVSQELRKAGVRVEVRNGKLHFLKPDERMECTSTP